MKGVTKIKVLLNTFQGHSAKIKNIVESCYPFLDIDFKIDKYLLDYDSITM